MGTRMDRKQFLKQLGAGTVGMAASARIPVGRSAAAKPNIVFLFTDDQRYDAFRAAGCPEIQTPNIDALAARGTAFRKAYIRGSWSGAVCMPSRAMLLTGRNLFHLRGERESLGSVIPAGHVTLPEALRGNGYHTHFIGKWHQDRPALNRCFDSADAVFFGGMSDHYGTPLHRYDPTGAYDKNSASSDPKVHDSTAFSDAAIRFLRNRSSVLPFFLQVSYKAPHDPRQAPAEFRALYEASRLPLPPNFRPEHPFDNGELRIRDENLAATPRDPDEIRKHLAEYYAITSHLDFEIGRVLGALRDVGLEGDTIVVCSSDNGLAVGQHGLMGKQNLYEHSIGVPLIFAGPRIPRGVWHGGLCCLTDIFATLCNLTGTAVPATVEGRSLAAAVLSGAATGHHRLWFAYRHLQRALREGRWKLIHYQVGGRHETQLFDLEADPWETRNLAIDAGQLERVRSLTQTLAVELRTAGDTAKIVA